MTVNQFQSRAEAEGQYLARVDAAVPAVSSAIVAAREAKWQEARDGPGPLLRAEAEALGITPQQAAERVLAARQRSLERQATAEAARIRAKQAIRAAATPAEMHRIAHDYIAALETAL